MKVKYVIPLLALTFCHSLLAQVSFKTVIIVYDYGGNPQKNAIVELYSVDRNNQQGQMLHSYPGGDDGKCIVNYKKGKYLVKAWVKDKCTNEKKIIDSQNIQDTLVTFHLSCTEPSQELSNSYHFFKKADELNKVGYIPSSWDEELMNYAASQNIGLSFEELKAELNEALKFYKVLDIEKLTKVKMPKSILVDNIEAGVSKNEYRRNLEKALFFSMTKLIKNPISFDDGEEKIKTIFRNYQLQFFSEILNK